MPETGLNAPAGDVPGAPLGRLVRVEAWALRAPIAVPVVTSFGTMRDRPAVFVRLTAADGAQGWGEVWCNFPGVGAEHRARLLIDTVAPLALAGDWRDTEELRDTLTRRLAVLALQTGEPGPLAQCVAALDVAVWDLTSRRAGLPLWRLLATHAMARGAATGPADGRVRPYASGLHPDQAVTLATERQAAGFRAFKLKVGFAAQRDRDALAGLRAALGPKATLMLDANQAWTPEEAPARIAALAFAAPAWMEEPITAAQTPSTWAALAAACAGVPLAAGENLRGEDSFEALMASGALAQVQPDVGKWGGLGGALAVAARARVHGVTLSPHWLGGPVGLLASMHLRAALGPGGWLEWDANPNPVHQLAQGRLPPVHEGALTLCADPGLGLDLDPAAFDTWRTWQGEASPR